MATKKKSLLAAAGNAGELQAIEDVFSTYLYTGNGSTQTITNGIDLAGEGGLVWIKSRSVARSHNLFDSERVGVGYKVLASDLTAAESDPGNRVTAFNADGFTMSSSTAVNGSAENYASWTFRKAPRFFDVVTYTGDGTTDGSKKISHNLGVTPGCVMVKRTDATGNWNVYHRETASSPETRALYLNLTSAYATGGVWGYTLPTETDFTVGSATTTNVNGANYVAYLFAHDPLGESGDGSDGLIACGSVSYFPGVEVDLGWEPQWILLKRTDGSQNWFLVDTMRSWTADGNAVWFAPNLSDAESAFQQFGWQLTSTGFRVTPGYGSGANYIYIAIRRGPMRQPESGTEVFDVSNGLAVPSFDFPPDFILTTDTGSGYTGETFDRLRGNGKVLKTNSTSAETSVAYGNFNHNGTQNTWGNNWGNTRYFIHGFKRAPSVFDVVAYQGDGSSNRSLKHNLGVAPEMIWVKARTGYTYGWYTYDATNGAGGRMRIDDNGGFNADTSAFANTAPTETDFRVGATYTNGSSGTFVAYLFATLPGVSKVGSYTGNGSSQVIDCGFTTSARFVLIKRSDNNSNWNLFDSFRGITVSSSPEQYLNQLAAQTVNNFIEPDSSGFLVNYNSVNDNDVNINGATYIFFAIS